MKRFWENIIDFAAYTLMFYVFISIGGWKLETRENIAICLTLGFFAGLINNIERVLRELFENKKEK